MSGGSPRRDRIVVVGGGLAGARACEHLRRRGFDGQLVLVAAEEHEPYNRPPLSKGVLTGAEQDTTLPVGYADLNVTLLRGTTAQHLDLAARLVHIRRRCGAPGLVGEPADRIAFDGLVVATGAEPIRLPGPGRQLTVRTIEDALELRERLCSGRHVVIVGASWVGAEVATAALARGCRVTCVEADNAPLARVLGPEVGRRLLPWWTGVQLRLGCAVREIAGNGVVLADGSLLRADTVVSAVGARPATGWLRECGLPLAGGLVVDEHLRAAPGVVAAGDVAAWWSRRFRQRLCVGHWDDAANAPAVAAWTLLADLGVTVGEEPAVYDPLPYFWSDQFGHKLQYVGHHDPANEPTWRDPDDSGRWSAAWTDDAGLITAALIVDDPRALLAARRAMAAGAHFADA